MTRKIKTYPFQRMMKNEFYAWNGYGDLVGASITVKEALKLLRNEHKWFRRMVKKELRRHDLPVSVTTASVLADSILTRLTQRRR